jgi:hypothetical protein
VCEVGPGGLPASQAEEPVQDAPLQLVMVIDVKHQSREVKSAITGQRRRIDVHDAGNRGPVTQQIQKMKIEMCEINSGRDRGATSRADPAHAVAFAQPERGAGLTARRDE